MQTESCFWVRALGRLRETTWGGRALALALGAMVAFGVGDMACGAAGGDSESGGGAGNGSGASGLGGGGPGSGGTIGGQGGGGLHEAGACAGDTYQGKLAPLDMYLMVDRSGSMVEKGSTKWASVTAAIRAFVQDPSSADLGVGLQYFPLPRVTPCPSDCNSDYACATQKCGCTSFGCQNTVCSCTAYSNDSCVADDYAKPVVAFGRCQDVAGQIVSSLQSQSPVGGTPAAPALQGGVAYAAQWAKANPTHVVIVVLATDGEPNECGSDVPTVSKVAADACAADPSIRTAVIGVGASLTSLNDIAKGGCTGSAVVVDESQDVVKQFRDALDKIRTDALKCEYLIPVPKSGKADYTLVNVGFTLSNGGGTETLGYVGSKDKCDARGGWYYDNDANPKKIIVCPASCDKFKADPMGRVDVLLGCQRIVY